MPRKSNKPIVATDLVGKISVTIAEAAVLTSLSIKTPPESFRTGAWRAVATAA